MVNVPESMRCQFCGNVDIFGERLCTSCIRSRQQAVLKRKCVCPKRLQRPTDLKRIGSRSWVSCERCLGQIRQVS